MGLMLPRCLPFRKISPFAGPSPTFTHPCCLRFAGLCTHPAQAAQDPGRGRIGSGAGGADRQQGKMVHHPQPLWPARRGARCGSVCRAAEGEALIAMHASCRCLQTPLLDFSVQFKRGDRVFGCTGQVLKSGEPFGERCLGLTEVLARCACCTYYAWSFHTCTT